MKPDIVELYGATITLYQSGDQPLMHFSTKPESGDGSFGPELMGYLAASVGGNINVSNDKDYDFSPTEPCIWIDNEWNIDIFNDDDPMQRLRATGCIPKNAKLIPP